MNLAQNQKYQRIVQRLQKANNAKRQRQEKEKKLARQTQEISSKVADDILFLLYERVKKEVYRSCGLSKKHQFTLYVDQNLMVDDDVKSLICERCGMWVTEVDTTYGYHHGVNKVFIRYTESVKRYTISASSKHSEQELNFPELIAENQRRRAIWEEYVEEFAQECLQKCIHCLEVTPNKHYGIPKELLITEGDKNPFDSCFKTADLEIEYRYLQKYQIDSLQSSIKQYATNVYIEIEKEDFQAPQFHFRKDYSWITKRKGALFDYHTFCQQYDDNVTPGLQKVIDEILHNIQLYDNIDEAYRTLNYQPKLVYYMEDSYATSCLMENAFNQEDGIHRTDLILALENELPGIKVLRTDFQCDSRQTWTPTTAKYRYPRHYVHHRRIVFFCKAIEPACQLARQMIAIEQDIIKLKGENRHLIVDAVINGIFKLANDLSDSDFDEFQEFCSSSVSLQLAIEVNGHEIRIDEVEDIEFAELLVADVARETEGMIRIKDLKPLLFDFVMPSQL